MILETRVQYPVGAQSSFGSVSRPVRSRLIPHEFLRKAICQICIIKTPIMTVEWVKRSTLRWFGHIEKMENEEFVKKVYFSSDEGPNRKGRPLGRWEDRVTVYMSERGVRENGLEQAGRECMDRER